MTIKSPKVPYGYSPAGPRCVNSNRGTFNHECGRPATWIGSRPSRIFKGETHAACYCDQCKDHGDEARCERKWTPIFLPDGWTWQTVSERRAKWQIDNHMVPIVQAPGCVAWGTINSTLLD